MIAISTLKIMHVTESEWTALSLIEQKKLVRQKLKLIHPDHNHGQDHGSEELIQFHKYLKGEDNNYLQKYLPENCPQDTRIYSHFSTNSSTFSNFKSKEPHETAQSFFADYKNTVRLGP